MTRDPVYIWKPSPINDLLTHTLSRSEATAIAKAALQEDPGIDESRVYDRDRPTCNWWPIETFFRTEPGIIVSFTSDERDLRYIDTYGPPVQASIAGHTVCYILTHSGLTKAQLAKALGISRQTLYAWTACCGGISAYHLKQLRRFAALVHTYDTGSVSATRLSLLRTSTNGLSAYNRFRIERSRDTPPVHDFVD